MSGHNKWSQIKHKKALTDAKKGKLFSKLSRLITISAREKGGDPNINASLKMIIDRARTLNMPIDNIERAIKKGTGELEGSKIEELILEAYGPGGAALIIEGTTDNRNRTISEIKFLLSEHNGKLAEPGSVIWLFEHVGIINIEKPNNKSAEEIEMAALESGCQDWKWLDEQNLEIYTKPEELEKIKKALEAAGLKIGESSLAWKPKNEAPQSNQAQLEKLMEELDEHDDINEIYTNSN